MALRVVWTGGKEFAAGLTALTGRSQVAGAAATKQVAAALIRQAKVNASNPARRTSKKSPGLSGPLMPGQRRIELGRVTRFGTVLYHREGGPGVVTGRLRNSIVVTSQGPVGSFAYQVTVAPTVVYARRLELGFTGTDSRGRRYKQPPYPYFTPAYEFVMRIVAPRLYEEAWRSALS